MAINFPAAPNLNDTFVSGGVTYTWDGTVWVSSGPAAFVQKSGDTMTGDLTVPNLVASSDVQAASLNSGPLAGMRNALVNGDFRVAQRGTTTALTTGPGQFVADRWFITGQSANNATVEDGRVAGIPCINLPTAGSGYLNQAIELPAAGSAGPFQPNSTWTLSVWATDDLSGKGAYIIFRDVPEANTNQQPNTVPALAATGAPAIGSFNQYSTTFTINATIAATNIMMIVGLDSTAGGRFSQIQLEPGPVASPWEVRPIGTELALCQRYFYALWSVDGGPAGRQTMPGIAMNIDGAGNHYAQLPAVDARRNDMRIPPTVEFHSGLQNAPVNNYPGAGEWSFWYNGQGTGFKSGTQAWTLRTGNSGIRGISTFAPDRITGLMIGNSSGASLLCCTLDAEL